MLYLQLVTRTFESIFTCSIILLLFMMLHKVVLTFESVDEILKCDHCYRAVLSCGAVYYGLRW